MEHPAAHELLKNHRQPEPGALEMDAATILSEALQKSDEDSRARFLDVACGGNADLKREVEELLVAHQGAGDFLRLPNQQAFEPTHSSGPPAARAGDQIDNYKLLQQIGEGGFGAVYMAEQTKPVRRKVALKIIKPGMDTKEVIARFEAERQALALMDHPNIARVLDGGTTEHGRPYFVMELVKGIPITRFCDENRLSTEKRLRLFTSVCRAIQHAHQKGVIHRDIKPNNVLVTLHDGEPVPRVIDFGVAKAISQQLTEKTMFTAFGQMIGTPQYMSPEQAEMSGLDVDTRSDIYSLGVLLYELLTGTTPLDPKRLRETAYYELQRLIREEEPPRPSTRVTALHEQSAVVASNRDTVADKLEAQLRGDLDWIVMRSLEKHRERRYDTANALADDVVRFLNDDAVEACPPSLTYRLRKFAQRNKLAIAASTAVAAALVVGFSAAVWQAVRATNALDDAVTARESANTAMLKAETEAQRANEAEQLAVAKAALAADREQTVSSVTDFLVKEIITKGNPYIETNRELTVRELLVEIADNPDAIFPDDQRAEAAVRHYVGVICHRVGMVDQAQRHLTRALELREDLLGDGQLDTARTKFALAYALLDFRLRYSPLQVRRDNADRRRSLLDDALSTFEKQLGPNHPETLDALALKAFGTGYTTGNPRRALEVYQELMARAPDGLPSNPDDPLDLLGSVFILVQRDQIGRDPEIDAEIKIRYERACQRLPVRHPQRAFWAQWRGTSLHLQGHTEESLPLLKESYDIRKYVLGLDNYFTFLSARALAAVHARNGDVETSITLLEECLQQFPEHSGQALNLGVLYLDRNAGGDRRRWLRTATSLLDQYERTDNPSATHNTLKLSLVAAASSDQEKTMQQRAIEMGKRYRAALKSRFGHDILDAPAPEIPGNAIVLQNARLAIALTEYRADAFENARELFQQVEQGPLLMIRAIAFAAHAALAAKEGDQKTARRLLRQAHETAKLASDKELYHYQYFVWNRRHMLTVLLDEAREVIHEAGTAEQES